MINITPTYFTMSLCDIEFNLASLNSAMSVLKILANNLLTKLCCIIFLIKYLSDVVLFLDDASLSYRSSNCLNVALFTSYKSTSLPRSSSVRFHVPNGVHLVLI